MSRKLAAKASLIQLPPSMTAPPNPPSLVVGEAAPSVVTAGGRPGAADARVRTAPGSMAMFMASQSTAIKEVEELRLRLRSFDGSRPMLALPAARVRPSRWANRHADALADLDFQELKADIAAAGANVQPICVRRVAGSADADHEIVFGHRRHRACLELGLPVQAVVVEVDDRALFETMERENRSRKNLSAWEQGAMYRRALEAGLYPSQRQLAEAIGVDVAIVSKALALARLPDAVVEAFASPLDVQFRWAQPLGEALQRDPDGVVERARAIRGARNGELSAQQVLAALLHPQRTVLSRSTPTTDRRVGRAGHGAVLGRDRSGRAVLRFDAGVLTPAREKELVAWLQAMLARREG